MLKIFRHKNVAKIVLWSLLILILPAFVLWGTGSLSGSKNKGPRFVGAILSKKISFDDFANSLTSVRCQILLRYYSKPKTMTALLKNDPFMGRLAWDRLIMLKEAQKNKIKVPDKDVISYIRGLPIFLRDGRFDERIYAYLLRNSIGLDPRGFEEIMRQNLAIKKLNDAEVKNMKISDDEIFEAYKKEFEKFKIAYVFFPAGDFFEEVKVDDKDARDYYEEHKEEFLLPAKDKDPDEAPRPAGFEEVKASIEYTLKENRARDLALKHAEEEYKKIADLVKEEGQSFEKAVSGLGLKTKETVFFVKSDYLEGLGEALLVAESAMDLKKDEIAKPVLVRKGAVIFRVLETESCDTEKFKKEKDEYAKKALDRKKEKYLSDWLRGLEMKTTLNIDLKDYEKYYK